MQYAYKNKLLKLFAYLIDGVGRILFCWIRRNIKIDSKTIRKILVVKLDHLGDCFMATPFFEYLSKNFPNSEVDVLCLELTAPLFMGNPYISEVITFNYFRTCRGVEAKAGFKRTSELIKKLRNMEHDLLIDLRGEAFISLLGLLIVAKYRLGFEKEEILGFLYTHPLNYNMQNHETEKYKIILNSLGINTNTNEWKPKIYVAEKKTADVQKVLEEFSPNGIITFHVGAGLAYKRWPLEKFTELIIKIVKNYDYEIALLGDEGDKEFSQMILENIRTDRVRDLTGRLSIRDSYSFLTNVDFFIGNDSVLAHFAGALNISTIELMNKAVSVERWAAIGQRVYVLIGADDKHKCLLDKCSYPCPNMQAITVERVLKVFSDIANKNKGLQ